MVKQVKVRLAFMLLWAAAECRAQTTPSTTQSSGTEPEVIRLTLHPMAVQPPVLRNVLLPPLSEQRPGDGAAWYMVGFSWLPPQEDSKGQVTALWERLLQQLDGDAASFSATEARKALEGFSPAALHWFDDAARCETANWNPDLRGKGINALLPYLNNLRVIANVEVVRARMEVAQHDFAAAQHSLQTTFSMAFQLGGDPIFVQGLVASGICRLALDQAVTMWVEQPDAPNLYWPLTAIARPPFNLYHVAAAERAMLGWTDPRYAQALAGTLPPDDWPGTLTAMLTTLLRLRQQYVDGSHPFSNEQLASQLQQLKTRLLPAARKRLANTKLAAEVAAIGDDQAVGEYCVAEYQAMEDQWCAELPLPFAAGKPLLLQLEQDERRAESDGNPLLFQVLGIAERGRATVAVEEQDVAVLRVVEALRDYAARHRSSLPAALAEVTGLPIPEDPVSGQPFVYDLDGPVATLEPTPVNAHLRQYRLTIAR